MAKTFACKDIGMSCGFKTKAKTDDELMEKIKAHAAEAHNMKQVDAATAAKIKAAIKSSMF
jgi:predicted small metal-binding protein